jgi:hypothetical protein
LEVVVRFTPRPIYPGERATVTHYIEGWVGPRAGLDEVEKIKFLIIQGLELRPLGRSALFLLLFIWFVMLLALRPLLAYCASLG